MEDMEYTVVGLDGDYAYLARTEPETGSEPTMVARALLPENIREGSRLKRVLFDYELME